MKCLFVQKQLARKAARDDVCIYIMHGRTSNNIRLSRALVLVHPQNVSSKNVFLQAVMMSGVGPAGAVVVGGGAIASDNGGGGGGGGGVGGSDHGGHCLLCFSPKANINSLDVLEPLDPNYGLKVNSNTWAMFVLRKLLLCSREEVEHQLVTRGGEVEPAHWLQICGDCVGWLQAFRTADKAMGEGVPGAEEKVKVMRRQVKDKLRKFINNYANRGDGAKDVGDILDMLKREVEEVAAVQQSEEPDEPDESGNRRDCSSSAVGSVTISDPPLGDTASSSLEISELPSTWSSTTTTAPGTSHVVIRRVEHHHHHHDGSHTKVQHHSTNKNKYGTCVECVFCHQGFPHQSHLVKHLGTHTREKPYICKGCGKEFARQRSLKSHFSRIHLKHKKPYQRLEGSKRFTSSGSLTQHFGIHASEVEEEEVVQPDDLVVGDSHGEARNSLALSVSISDQPSKIEASSSAAGNGASDNNNGSSSLKFGKMSTTDDVVPQVGTGEEIRSNPIEQLGEHASAAGDIAATGTADGRSNPTNPCKSGNDAGMMASETTCANKQEGSTDEGPVKKKKKKSSPVVVHPDHITILGGDPPMYQCNVCRKTFKTKAHIKYHEFCMVGGGGNRPFKCEQCGKGFIAKGHYEYHLRTHTGERPNVCPICGKGFIQRDKMTRHIRSHTGEKPFVCLKCNRGFATAEHLRRHTLVHAGERPFACTYCGKRFTAMATLKQHLTTHTGERRFSCNHCGKGFGFKCNLDRHLQTHTGERPYACDQCTRAFSNRKDLRRHLVIHSGQHPFKCSLCGTAFRRKDNLDRHIMNTHEQPKEVSKQLANEAAAQYLKNTAKSSRESLANIPVSKVNAVVISSIVDQKADLRRASVKNKVPAGKSSQSSASSSSTTGSCTSATKRRST